LPAGIGNGKVARDPELSREAVEADVIRARRRRGDPAAPSEARVADDADARLAAEGLHDAEELGGAKGAVVLLEARREVVDAKGPVLVVEEGLEDVGVGEVPVRAGLPGGRSDLEAAAGALVEQRGEHRLGVEARQAAPDHAPVEGDGRILAVSDEPEILQPHDRSPCGTGCRASVGQGHR